MNLIKTGILSVFVALSIQNAHFVTLFPSITFDIKENYTEVDQLNRKKKPDCVKVSVFSNSLELIKDKPFLLTITIQNQSKEKISLNYLPIAIVEKKGIPKEDMGIKGNQYYSVLDFEKSSEFMRKDFLEPEEKIEFEVDITKSKWGHSIQANLPSSDIFTILPKGEYELSIKFRTKSFEKIDENISIFLSNSFNVSYQ